MITQAKFNQHSRHGVYPGNRGDYDHGSCHEHRGPSGASHVEYDKPGHGLEPQAVVKLYPEGLQLLDDM